MEKIAILFFFLLFGMTGCAMPYVSGDRIPGGLYGNQYNAGYSYSNYSQERTVSIQEVGTSSGAFVAEAGKFHRNITGMSMCANGGVKTDTAATATGTVNDNSGRINYQIATMSSTTEVCNNLPINLKEVGKK